MHLSIYAKSLRDNKDYWTEYTKQYGIFKLPFAKEAFFRLGISISDFDNNIKLNANGEDFISYISGIFTDNQEFRSILEKNSIMKSQWVGVWTWLERREREIISKSFILDNDHIESISSISEAFSYGQIYNLSKFGSEIVGTSISKSLKHFYARSFSLFEQTLNKAQGSNIILVSHSIEEGINYIHAFIPNVKKKKFFQLDSNVALAIKNATELNNLLIKVLNECVRAGNVILVIPNIASIIASGHMIGCDVALLLTEYMQNPNLHVILIADRYQYHTSLETNISLVQASEKIELDVIAPEMLQNIAENEVLIIESKHKIIFSYAALSLIIDSVIKYAPENMHDTLKDYLDEVAIYSKKHNSKIYLITDEIARKCIAEKTGTQGTFIDNSKTTNPIDIKLILGQRVKGQEQAIDAVAKTLERVRSGLVNTKRPLGTFLFLGPTGVGKTETAKALAEAYFGTEEKMVRLDMSEFGDSNSVAKLIGTFELGEIGILTAKVKDTRHGVILFDEIEKAHEKVRDLMLQILDEGYFTDAKGERVNMKNFIMIATSNAGSSEIYEADNANVNLDKKVIISHLIEQGVFKPEFLNRFDDIAIFNSLKDRQLASIIELKLNNYEADLYNKKAIHIKITPSLIEYIMNHLDNKSFGGREIQRAIQNNIESVIVKDILDGKAKPGTTASFSYNNEENKLNTIYN
jgi:ATP-dependent Clp protease ATP-binding subunit ClpC